MKYINIIIISLSFLIADDTYCNIPDLDIDSHIFSREYYDIGDIISEEDQQYPYTVCHSDGDYELDTTFRFANYSGNIILISMNATW